MVKNMLQTRRQPKFLKEKSKQNRYDVGDRREIKSYKANSKRKLRRFMKCPYYPTENEQ